MYYFLLLQASHLFCYSIIWKFAIPRNCTGVSGKGLAHPVIRLRLPCDPACISAQLRVRFLSARPCDGMMGESASPLSHFHVFAWQTSVCTRSSLCIYLPCFSSALFRASAFTISLSSRCAFSNSKIFLSNFTRHILCIALLFFCMLFPPFRAPAAPRASSHQRHTRCKHGLPAVANAFPTLFVAICPADDFPRLYRCKPPKAHPGQFLRVLSLRFCCVPRVLLLQTPAAFCPSA